MIRTNITKALTKQSQNKSYYHSILRINDAFHGSFIRRILLFILIITITARCVNSQQQDPMKINGGSVLAMAGNECVVLAVDKRFGSGMQMVNVAPRHLLTLNPRLMVAFTGLEGDIQSLSQELKLKAVSKHSRNLGFMNHYNSNHLDDKNNEEDNEDDDDSSPSHQIIKVVDEEDKQKFSLLDDANNNLSTTSISPRTMTMLTSHVLYNRRRSPYYVEPIIVGLQREEVKEKNNFVIKYRPILSSLDMIGAISKSDAFVCAGAASNSLYGTAESHWKPNLNSDELLECCGKAFVSALERDCYSGYGATLYLITKDSITKYDIACRDD